MARHYWLVKSEPNAYAWSDLVRVEPVSLAQIKADAALAEIPLVTQSRLSVMPLARPAFQRILTLGKTRLRRS